MVSILLSKLINTIIKQLNDKDARMFYVELISSHNLRGTYLIIGNIESFIFSVVYFVYNRSYTNKTYM